MSEVLVLRRARPPAIVPPLLSFTAGFIDSFTVSALLLHRSEDLIFADVRLRGVMEGIDLAQGEDARAAFSCDPHRDIRASASANYRPVSLTCPNRASRSKC